MLWSIEHRIILHVGIKVCGQSTESIIQSHKAISRNIIPTVIKMLDVYTTFTTQLQSEFKL